MKTCGNCGEVQKKDTARFCYKCGTPLEAQPGATGPAMPAQGGEGGQAGLRPAPPPPAYGTPPSPPAGQAQAPQAPPPQHPGAPMQQAQPPMQGTAMPPPQQQAMHPQQHPPARRPGPAQPYQQPYGGGQPYPQQRPGPPQGQPGHPPPYPPGPRQGGYPGKPPKKGGGKMLALVLLVLIVAGAAAGYFVYGNRLKARDAEQITDFVQAIRRKSVSTIQEIARSPGLELSESTLAPLFKMADPDGGALLDELEASLTGQLEGGDGNPAYSAITLEPEKTLFVFTTHTIVLTPVSLELGSSLPGAEYMVDGETASAGTVEGLVPGLHDVFAKYEKYGVTLRSEAAQLRCFSTTTAHEARFDVKEDRIPFDYEDATVYINGEKTDIKPVDGYIPIAPSIAGMQVTIEAVDGGSRYTADFVIQTPGAMGEVEFDGAPGQGSSRPGTDPADSAEEPEEGEGREEEEPEPEEEDPDLYRTAMLSYYQSYLNAINDQNVGRLEACTDKQREYAAERVANPLNSENLFRFTEIVIDLSTVEFFTRANGDEGVRLRIGLRYDYTPRAAARSDWQPGGNTQWCEMIRVGPGEWLCDFTEVKDVETLSDSTVTIR